MSAHRREAAPASPIEEKVMYVEAPTFYEGAGPSVFLAGGITDCPDWQSEARSLLPGVTVLNPRRANFLIHDPSASRGQIEWEYWHLQRATVVLFWFAPGPSPQPIALYELGRHAALERQLAVGCDPEYSRRLDVVIQLLLARPELSVESSLFSVCSQALGLIEALRSSTVPEAPPARKSRITQPPSSSPVSGSGRTDEA